VPEAVLAIANCQLEIKDNKAARKTLEDLVAKYPSSEAAAAARDRLARFK
jgi:TolA-binding protein